LKKLKAFFRSKKICAFEKHAPKFAAIGNNRSSTFSALIIKTKTLPDLG
jgi:hypothetical protein